MLPVGTTLRLQNLPIATISLIVINTAVFFYDIAFIQYYYDIPIVEYFIALFAVFFHVDFYHLFGNMLFLWIFGSYVEDRIGSKKFLFYYFICEIGSGIFHLIFDGRPSVGASGAISGIMGIYLLRCHYSKIKTIVPVLFWFIKVNINAVWLLLFWILRDFYAAFLAEDYVAHWAHIGGYVAGIVIGKVNNYWSEAKVEHLSERAAQSMRITNSVADAERDLFEILTIDPDNADAHLELARYYAGHSQKKDKGKQHYLAAARVYYVKKHCTSMAGEIFMEYLERYRDPQEPVLHLKYADTLSNVLNYSGAAKILEPVVHRDLLQGVIGEKILLNYITFCLKADLKEPAQDALALYKEIYPDSTKVKRSESLVGSYNPARRKKVIIEHVPEKNTLAQLNEAIHDTVSDPIFWIASIIFINYSFGIFIFTSLLLAFLVTMGLRKISSGIGMIYEGSSCRTEEEGFREYNINTFLDKARACERNEQYEDAIEYLNAVLREDKKGEHHLAVRHQLARLCHKMADRPQEALQHYRALFKIAPDDHPFKRDAYEGMKELTKQSTEMVPGYT